MEASIRRSLESLKNEAKRWLHQLEANDQRAHTRLTAALGAALGANTPSRNAPSRNASSGNAEVRTHSSAPTLRDVQHALAREHGFAGWTELKIALSPSAEKAAHTIELYEDKARALLDAYETGTPEAMERHYALTWHRRAWQGMRRYVQLDLGKRPANDSDDVEITIDDARYLIAIEHGFENWNALCSFVEKLPSEIAMTERPVGVRMSWTDDAPFITISRDWTVVLRSLRENPDAALDAHGCMTDEILEQVSRIQHITELKLGNSKALTDVGIRHLARLPELRRLDLSSTGITDDGLKVLRDLPNLESLSLVMTAVSDAGLANISHCRKLQRLNVMWTHTGDGTIRALAGQEHLTHFWSGNYVTDAGLVMLHDFPVFKTWHDGETKIELLSPDAEPNNLTLRGRFTDNGLNALRGLDGLFGLNLDDSALSITAAGMIPLASLPRLGKLSVDAKDDWMRHIANIPALRFLSAQDTTATDDGWVALSKSQTLEGIWGRRCHGLQTRGFTAFSRMPKLRALSVSCLNVDDSGIALLPHFLSLRELMPMDIPDAGYQHIGRCSNLESLTLMYCRDTTDAATEHITTLSKLKSYFNSYTTITDRTPQILSSMDSLEEVTFDACHNLTDAGVAALARLPDLRQLRVSGRQITKAVTALFPASVTVHFSH